MLKSYREHVAERQALGIPPLPLSAQQTAELIELLKAPPKGEEAILVDLITHRVPAGVDDAAKVKASYLAAVAHGTEKCALISRARATELLGTMLGGYNISPLVDLLDDAAVAAQAAEALKKTLLMFDQFHDVKEKADKGNAHAKAVYQSSRSAPVDYGVDFEGNRRNQYRRFVAGPRRLEPPGHSAARTGHAEE